MQETQIRSIRDWCQFLESDKDLSAKIETCHEIRESLEIFQSPLYPQVLESLVPTIIKLLKVTRPAFTSVAPEHKLLRHALVDIIHRLPQNDDLRIHSVEILQCLLELLNKDNEENAVLALKTIVELFKAYKTELEPYVEPFFDLVLEFYDGLKATIDHIFGPNEEKTVINNGIIGDLDENEEKPLAESSMSFKVLTECPIIIAMLVQIYKNYHFSHVPKLIPSIIKPENQRKAHLEAEKKAQIFIGVSPLIKNRVAYNDLKALQVKTVSFVAYILRSLGDNVRQYEQGIADSVIQLIKDCPPESSNTRKELLVATRHIWYTDFRAAFVPYIDILLNENVLLGTGMTCKESLRPLAHSVLVDLIHHVRNELSVEQIAKSIFVYSRILHDFSFAPNIQTMCAKLLANLSDCIVQIEDKSQARVLLFRILKAFSTRLKSFDAAFPTIVKVYQSRARQGAKNNNEIESVLIPSLEGFLDLGNVQPIKTNIKALDHAQDLSKDIRFLVKNLVQGVKSVLFGLGKCSAGQSSSKSAANTQAAASTAAGSQPAEAENSSIVFSREQLYYMIDIFHFGLNCFDSFVLDGFDQEGNFEKSNDKNFYLNRDNRILIDEKDTIDAFASVFVSVEVCVFQEILQDQIEHLVYSVMRNNALAAICQCFVTAVTTTQHFCGILTKYLLEHFDSLGSTDVVLSETLVKLFKLIFMAITYYPEKIEIVLRPHMSDILLMSFKSSAQAQDPFHYYQVLRALFRAIAGGRYESLYQEVVPLLQITLENLNHLLSVAVLPSQKEIFAELCLTVPVRLSVLLPYLSYLMQPLICALNSESELASQGLRTLELCLDNLTREFLDPIFAPVSDDILHGLWRQVDASTSANCQAAIRILGKLGGKNRVLDKSKQLEYVNTGKSLVPELPLADGSVCEKICLDDALGTCRAILLDTSSSRSLEAKKQAFSFVKCLLPLVIDAKYSNLGNKVAIAISNSMQLLSNPDSMQIDEKNSSASNASPFVDPPQFDRQTMELYLSCMRDILECVLVSVTIEGISTEAKLLWNSLSDVFLSISIVNSSETFSENECQAFVDALASIASIENEKYRLVVQEALVYFYERCLSLVQANCSSSVDANNSPLRLDDKDAEEVLGKLDIYEKLSRKFTSLCYLKSFDKKAGGCLGIKVFLNVFTSLGRDWFLKRQMIFVKALIYLLKDSSELLSFSIEEAKENLFKILGICYDSHSSSFKETDDNDDDDVQDKNSHEKSCFNSLISLLMGELSNPNGIVRETVQKSFQLLAELTECDISDMLLPAKDRFLGPIYTKPLRALPFQMQIGNIDAITYCLSLPVPLLTFNDELIRLLHECLALADAEDQALVGKTSQYKNAMSLISLRVVCVKLLSSAMMCPEFSQAKQEHIRSRIISVFFKSLYSKSSQVVEVANKGLQQVLSQQHKLPKNLLQAGLRPILVNLSDHKRLTVSGLQGLARLLELLTNYFKVEIGKKLLDHLRQWAEPKVLEDASSKLLGEVDEVKIMVAILDVFHLLPPAANVFLDELVREIIDLESKLKRVISSPFRMPLIKFLNRYSQESIQYFLDNISSPKHRQLLLGLIDMEAAVELRQELENNAESIIGILFEPSSADKQDYSSFGFELLRHISKHQINFVCSQPMLIKIILEAWDKLMTSPLQASAVDGEGELFDLLPDLLMACAIGSKQLEADVIFELLRGFETENVMDYTNVRKFLYETAIKSNDQLLQQDLLSRCLKVIVDESQSESTKATCIKFLLVPLLLETHQEPFVVKWMQEELAVKLDKVFFKPIADETEMSKAHSDPFILEMLQVAIIFMVASPTTLEKYRKNIVKCGYQLIKLADMTCRHSCYVLLAQFIQTFDSPTKMMLGLFIALLKSHQPESKLLVKQALDTLMTVLPKKLEGNNIVAAGDIPVWIRWTKRVLDEGGHSLTQLVTIFNLLTRHSSLYEPYKDLFLHEIVSSLGKLALAPNASLETRVMSIELGEMLNVWIGNHTLQDSERQAEPMEDIASSSLRKKRKIDKDISAVDKNQRDNVSLQTRESICTFYLKLALTIQDVNNVPAAVGSKSLEVLKLFSNVWEMMQLSPEPFDKLSACEITPERINAACHQLEILNIITQNKSVDWIKLNLSVIMSLLSPWMRVDHLKLVNTLESIYKTVFNAVKHLDSKFVAEYTVPVESIIQQGLSELSHSFSLVCLLECYYTDTKAIPTQVCTDSLRLLQKLAAAYVTSPSSNATPAALEALVKQITSLLRLLRVPVAPSPEMRKLYLAQIAMLLDSTSALDDAIAFDILSISREWTLQKELYPTVKEKATILQKMNQFSSPLVRRQYLELVADIYSTPHLLKSDMAIKLESAFLHGLQSQDPLIRSRFFEILDRNIAFSSFSRLKHILSLQNWESVGSSFWITQAVQLLLGSNWQSTDLSSIEMPFKINLDKLVNVEEEMLTVEMTDAFPLSKVGGSTAEQPPTLKPLSQTLQTLVNDLKQSNSSALLSCLGQLCHHDNQLTVKLWPKVFGILWTRLPAKEQGELVKMLVILLAKDYHLQTAEQRPNSIQSLLAGVAECQPELVLPPQLIKFLAKTFNCWHIGLGLLETSSYADTVTPLSKDDDRIREVTLDAITSLYSELSETEYLIGHWRRRSQFSETCIALSFEQISDWSQAQLMYENAQAKARTGMLPFTPAEYNLWEDHWVKCAKKLQQWDLLADLAKHEGDTGLLIDCAWRISDWNQEKETLELSIKSALDQSSPQFHAYQSFLNLIGESKESAADHSNICDKGLQVLIKRWASLPAYVSDSHLECLHYFQRMVELQEAAQIQQNLVQTTAGNIETKTGELKSILTTWRERLPNPWDDICIWSDLIAWRQHVFSLINKAYIPIISLLQQSQQTSSPSSSYGYRGYHETAWIINRFAHVARKQELTEVCINSLSKIYTLPNIEIQEAFYKLREQAKCHLSNPSEYSTGLDVINNTNLMYFSATQKAEFFTLKGIFLSKLSLHGEAAEAFSSATQIDLYLARAWGCWGEYHDKLFTDKGDINNAHHALNCYLQVSSLLNNSKCRKYLARILWLLGQDDDANTISSAYETFRQDPQQQQPVWYWVTFIPQLLSALQHKEANSARQILLLLAKAYPQALHFHLRTSKEDYLALKKQTTTASAVVVAVAAAASSKEASDAKASPDASATPAEAGGEITSTEADSSASPQTKRMPWEHVDEITGLLKTAFPLLTLSMETMIEQILHKLKPSTDEDIYRLIVALMNDGIQQLARDPGDSGSSLSPATELNLQRFAESMYPNHIKYKAAFEQDFIKAKPTLTSLVDKFRSWRDRLETLLESRPRKQSLEQYSHYLMEFENQKFDEIEMLGQYLEMSESPKDFIRIDRFEPEIEVLRAHGGYQKRICIRGHDGSLNYYTVQHPAGRSARREEKIVQLFQIFNNILETQVEAKRRALQFHLPGIIPLAPQVRLVRDDPSNMTLQEVFEQHCKRNGLYRDQSLIHFVKRMKEAFTTEDISKKSKVEVLNLKTEIMEEISEKYIPETVFSDFINETMPNAIEYFIFRKKFTRQLATATFMTFLFSIGHRQPHRFHFSRHTGNVWTSEVIPTISSNSCLYTNQEAIPFRFTPNIQHFLTPFGIEGPFSGALVALAKSLIEPENFIQDYLFIFVRDDLLAWQSSSRRPAFQDSQLRDNVLLNVDLICKRASSLACTQERLQDCLANQTILDLVAQAVNPLKLAQMDITFIPQL